MLDNPKIRMIDVVSNLEKTYDNLEKISKETGVDVSGILNTLETCINKTRMKTNEVLNKDINFNNL